MLGAITKFFEIIFKQEKKFLLLSYSLESRAMATALAKCRKDRYVYLQSRDHKGYRW